MQMRKCVGAIAIERARRASKRVGTKDQARVAPFPPRRILASLEISIKLVCLSVGTHTCKGVRAHHGIHLKRRSSRASAWARVFWRARASVRARACECERARASVHVQACECERASASAQAQHTITGWAKGLGGFITWFRGGEGRTQPQDPHLPAISFALLLAAGSHCVRCSACWSDSDGAVWQSHGKAAERHLAPLFSRLRACLLACWLAGCALLAAAHPLLSESCLLRGKPAGWHPGAARARRAGTRAS
jgi:hypothetical protein